MQKRIRSEAGGSLIVVLMIITLFGLIISALLTEAGASAKNTVVVSGHEEKVYAADAGIQFALQQLRQDRTLCPRVGVSGPTMPTIEVNDLTVEVTCSVLSGSSGGSDGYAVVLTSPNDDSLILSGASGEYKNIGGHLYLSGGVDWGTGINLDKGDFIQQDHGSGCVDPPTEFWNDSAGDPLGSTHPDLIMDMPEYGYYCQPTSSFPVPNPPHKAPSTVPTVAVDLPAQTDSYTDKGSGSNACRVFEPGLYSQPPDLAQDHNYFPSGVYYFNWSSNDVFEVKDAMIYGGRPASYEEANERFAPPSSCDRDSDTGFGALFIFGGNARMFIDSHGGVELFSRTGEPGASDNLSFVAVPSGDSANWPTGAGGWTASTLSGDPVLDVKEGAQQDLAIHGMIYAPTEDVVLTATNSVVAQAMGGLVAYTLELKSSASADAFSVSIPAGLPNPRELVVTACTDPSASASCENSGGERPVSSRAVVGVANDAQKTVTVKSWRTRGVSDPS